MNTIATMDQFAAEASVLAMWQDERVKAARTLIGRMWKSGWGDTPPAEIRHLIEPHIDEYVTNWLFKAVASDADHPRFVCDFLPAHEWNGTSVPGARTGGDNPDNIYRPAGVRHGAHYVVRGRPAGTIPANTSFTLVGNFGTSVTIQTIESQDLAFNDDGSFELSIGPEPSTGNHLTTAAHVKFLFVRDSLDSWRDERPFELSIEKIDGPEAEPLTHDQMIERAVFRMREDVSLYHWFQSVWTSIQPGRYEPPELHRNMGGLVTQAIAKAHLVLDQDDAAIIEYDPAGARYAAIQLSDWLYRSLDADRIQSSLTQSQSHIDPDGRIRAVIARSDPGVWNWLDPGGFSDILVLHRWQALPDVTVRNGPYGGMQIVAAKDVKRALPSSTRFVTPDERSEQLRGRRMDYGWRFGRCESEYAANLL